MRGMAIGIASITLTGTVWLGPARAQAVIEDRDAIRACVCAEQHVTALFGVLQERQRNYENSQKTLAQLNDQLSTRRTQINVYNEGDVDAYKQLLAQSDRAAVALADEATPSYNDAVAHYDEALAGYTAQCGGKSYNQTVYNSVLVDPSCPKE